MIWCLGFDYLKVVNPTGPSKIKLDLFTPDQGRVLVAAVFFRRPCGRCLLA
jgi:hypothetical protein